MRDAPVSSIAFWTPGRFWTPGTVPGVQNDLFRNDHILQGSAAFCLPAIDLGAFFELPEGLFRLTAVCIGFPASAALDSLTGIIHKASHVFRRVSQK